MNTREKKNLKHKYVKHIKDCISNFDILFFEKNIDISYFEELLMYAELCDHNLFYEHYQKKNWPSKNSHVRAYEDSIRETNDNSKFRAYNSIKNLKEDLMLNRVVMLKNLGI